MLSQAVAHRHFQKEQALGDALEFHSSKHKCYKEVLSTIVTICANDIVTIL